MASREEVIKLTIESAEAAKSVKEVRDSLKAIRNQMLGVAEDSQEFHQLAAAAAELKDRVQDANEAMAAMHPDGFQAVVGFAQKAAGAVAGLQGAMALFGGESEEVQQTIMKLQAAMALTQGLESLKDMSKAWRALNAVIAANPVIAVTVAVVALGTAIKEVVNYFNPLNTEARRLQRISEQTTKEVELRASYLDNEIKLAQARGDSEQSIYEKQKLQVAEKVKGAKAALAAAEATLKQQEAEKGLLDYIGEAYIMMLKVTGQSEMAAIQEKAQAARRQQNLQEYVDAVDQARLQLDNLITEQEIIEVNHTNFLKEQYKERAVAQQEQIQKTNEVFQPIIAMQVKATQDGVAAIKQGTLDLSDYIAEQQKTLVDKMQYLQDGFVIRTQNLNKKFNDSTQTATSQLFGALADASKKNAKAQKAFSVAQAVINTYQSATKALATLPAPASYIAAAASLVAGFAQVRNIMQTNVDNPSASGGGGGGMGGGMGLAQINDQPNINSAAQPSTLLDQQGNVINQQNNQPTAYVAVTEINEVNNNVQVVENLARF
jgi:hypothetical protein